MMKDNIDIKKARRDMMELWKDTFHDSSRYIDIVFDAYFQPENAFAFYDGEKLVAALLGVEYQFKSRDEKGETQKYKGLYLCGLATQPSYRRKGIMSQLMIEAENSAKDRGFDFTFLIPADSHLREYYEMKGYKTESFLVARPLEEVYGRTPEKLYIYTFREVFEMGKRDFVREVAVWCSEIEKESKNKNTLLHSPADMIAIITENENSIFITDCTFDLDNPILAKVRAVVFPTPAEEAKSNTWKISGVFFNEDTSEVSNNNHMIIIPEFIRATLREKYPDREFVLNLPFGGEEDEIVYKVPYAMVKKIAENKNLLKNENELFKIYLMLD